MVSLLAAPSISIAAEFTKYTSAQGEVYSERVSAMKRAAEEAFKAGDYESYRILTKMEHASYMINSRLADLSRMYNIHKLIKDESDKSKSARILLDAAGQLARYESNSAQFFGQNVQSHKYPDNVKSIIQDFNKLLYTSSKSLAEQKPE